MTTTVELKKYDADEGKVFDYAEAQFDDVLDEDGNVIGQEQRHMYTKKLFIGANDSIDNYIEVDEATSEGE